MKIAWPYVTLKVRDDTGALVIRELYKDAPVPANADKDDLARLKRKGAVVDEDIIVSDTPPFVPVDEKAAEASKADGGVKDDAETDDGLEPQRPGDNASKAAWVDYAVALRDPGVSEQDARTAAEGMTKADLITLHG